MQHTNYSIQSTESKPALNSCMLKFPSHYHYHPHSNPQMCPLKTKVKFHWRSLDKQSTFCSIQSTVSKSALINCSLKFSYHYHYHPHFDPQMCPRKTKVKFHWCSLDKQSTFCSIQSTVSKSALINCSLKFSYHYHSHYHPHSNPLNYW